MAIMARKFIKNCRFGRYYVMHSYNFFLAHGLLFNKRPFGTKLIIWSRGTTGQKEIIE